MYHTFSIAACNPRFLATLEAELETVASTLNMLAARRAEVEKEQYALNEQINDLYAEHKALRDYLIKAKRRGPLAPVPPTQEEST